MTMRGRWVATAAAVVLVVVAGACSEPTPTPSLSSAAIAIPSVTSEPTGTATAAPTTAASTPVASTSSASPVSTSSASPVASASAGAGLLPGEPDPLLTPGAINPGVTPTTLATTVCKKGWTATVRPPASYTTGLKRQQIAADGLADTRLADYEEDHLISLELGGAPRDPANLWPEPYTVTLPDGTPVGARVKDQLENRLNRLVCSGAMPLATAQRLIATHWIAAWRKYVAP